MEPQEPGQVNPTGKNLNKAVTTKLDDNRKRHSKTLVASQLVEHTLPYTGSTQQQWDHFRPKLWQLWLAFGSDYGKIDELMQRKYSFSASGSSYVQHFRLWGWDAAADTLSTHNDHQPDYKSDSSHTLDRLDTPERDLFEPPTESALVDHIDTKMPIAIGPRLPIWEDLASFSSKGQRTLLKTIVQTRTYVKIVSGSEISVFDHLQHKLEKYTGTPWTWFPFQIPRPLLNKGELCVTLTCADCKMARNLRVDPPLADCLRLFTREHMTPPPPGEDQPSFSRVLFEIFRGVLKRASVFKQLGQMLQNGRNVAVPANFTNVTRQTGSDNHWILLGFNVNWMYHSRVEVDDFTSDKVFMAQLKRSFRAMAGCLRFYLHPEHFGWCEFTKFKRINVESLVRVKRNLPSCPTYEFRPRPAADDPPISKYEWNLRYYQPKCLCNAADALAKIPKRNKAILLDVHPGEEAMWGLEIYTQPSCLRVIMWMIALLLGPLAVWIWWYGTHPGDWQDASVLMTTVIGLQTLFWVPLGARFRH